MMGLAGQDRGDSLTRAARKIKSHGASRSGPLYLLQDAGVARFGTPTAKRGANMPIRLQIYSDYV